MLCFLTSYGMLANLLYDVWNECIDWHRLVYYINIEVQRPVLSILDGGLEVMAHQSQHSILL